jgi:hypothetical protein
MPRYLVEAYSSAAGVDGAAGLARRAAEVGVGIRYLRTTFVPEDEMALHEFEAPSRDELEEAAGRAGLRFLRIVETIDGKTPQGRRRVGRAELKKAQP